MIRRLTLAAMAAALLATPASRAAAQDNRAATIRYTQSGFIGQYTYVYQPSFAATAGDRIVAIASPGEGNIVDLKLWISTDNVHWQLAQDEWGGAVSQTRKIDRSITATGVVYVRVSVNTGGYSGNYILSTDQTRNNTSATWGPADTCFGAVGMSCMFTPAFCTRLASGMVQCDTSAGSQKHDTCCSRYPDGHMCDGLSHLEKACVLEWGIAQNDVTQGRTWRRNYDPTFVSYHDSYRADSSGAATWAEGKANAASYRAPAGTTLRWNDIQEGFCGSSCTMFLGGENGFCAPTSACSTGGGGGGDPALCTNPHNPACF
jgi:hypothetical protein